MHETLLIKHAVGGRTFVDSDHQQVTYQAEPAEGNRWSFEVQNPPEKELEELLKWRSELNVFLFRHYGEEQPTVKIWFYVQDDTVKYDKAKHTLTFAARSSIEYVPQQFGYKL
ncbi:hypothetical protein [Paenibacillus radicis (ex Gao et al. 2016)]|uniref:Uncharacterized protein n=1 Tax=Paenibacillus radicis (ex Gao et al. 2016) TaxID=1737354 RepID=A0A917M3T5_9BACL|nr:hypothetical protein [Paenibacillus radicis (ex Gao et al. 2016)]GGG73621.1 hypothetical protein GCM10010918_32160 [Paenibacillus radicis (ex Gao et al. 2016)]